jgi:hypothetical protein
VTMEKDEEQEDFSPISQQPENDDSLMVEWGLSSYLDPRLLLGLLATSMNNLAIGCCNEWRLSGSAASAGMLVSSVTEAETQITYSTWCLCLIYCTGNITQSLSLADMPYRSCTSLLFGITYCAAVSISS